MALDTKQKRGSTLEVFMPWRAWLADPDSGFSVADRQSLLKLSSGASDSGTSQEYGIASETDTALAQSTSQSLLYGLSVEVDAALTMPAGGPTSQTYGLALETDTALALDQVSPSESISSVGGRLRRHAPAEDQVFADQVREHWDRVERKAQEEKPAPASVAGARNLPPEAPALKVVASPPAPKPLLPVREILGRIAAQVAPAPMAAKPAAVPVTQIAAAVDYANEQRQEEFLLMALLMDD